MQVTAIASLGGLLFVYDLGVISGALPAFDLSQSQQQLVVSILYVGGGLDAALGGTVCDTQGRKRAILFTDVGFLVAAVVLASWQRANTGNLVYTSQRNDHHGAMKN
jgi:MFS transporter, SP family, major inositol transporter